MKNYFKIIKNIADKSFDKTKKDAAMENKTVELYALVEVAAIAKNAGLTSDDILNIAKYCKDKKDKKTDKKTDKKSDKETKSDIEK